MTENSEQFTSENIPSEPTLGIKNPLVSRSPLGQKFLQPLGAKSLSVLDLSLFSGEGGELQQFSDWESPFLVESKPQLGNQAILQEQSLSSTNFDSSQVPELNREQTNNGESDFSQNPAILNPERSSIPISEDSQVRRESTSLYNESSNTHQEPQVSTSQPYTSHSKPSKSTIFREILGDKLLSNKVNNFTQKNNTKFSNSEEISNLPLIQRKAETANTEEVSNVPLIPRETQEPSTIESQPDLPSIQRKAEVSNNEELSNLPLIQRETQESLTIKNQSNLPTIQREPETSNSEEVSNLSSIQKKAEPLTAKNQSNLPLIQRETKSDNSEEISNLPSIQRETQPSKSEAVSNSPSIQRETQPSNIGETSNLPSIQRETEEPSTTKSQSNLPLIQRESESKLNQSNFIDESNQTVGELLSRGNLPEIQGVFENITSQKILGSQQYSIQSTRYPSQKSQDSIQAKPAINSQKYRNLVPESWSNIEELIGEEEKPKQNSNHEQSRPKKPPKSQLLPDSTQVGARGEIRASQFENQPSQIKELMQQTLANRGKLKEEVSSKKGHKVQPLTEQDIYSLEENIKSKDLVSIQKEEDTKDEVVTSEHLEELAREIYSVVCQRLQVERERYSFKSYYNRLPW